MMLQADKPYYQWTTFERGFDTPVAAIEAVKTEFNLPRCDICKDFPEKLEIGRLVRPWLGQQLAEVYHELIDIEVRIECHGKRWSFDGSQAQAYLGAMFLKGSAK